MLLSLPEELIVEVCQWLPLKGLANVMQTNRQMYRICRDDRLWVGHTDFPYRLKNEGASLSNSGVFGQLAAKIKGETSPTARLCHTAVVHGDSMYVQGGHTTVTNTQLFNNVKSDFWKFNFVQKRWEEITEPKLPTKTEHSAVVWENKMWLFGGFAGTHFSNEVVSYDFVTKQMENVTCTGDVPSPRSAHVAVAYDGKMYVFGGWNGTEQNNDLYILDLTSHVWAKAAFDSKAPQPLPRCSHCATVAPTAKSFFVFGGCGGRMQNYLADLWQFSFETMSWTDVGRLQPGSRMKMAEYRNKLYIYGGWNSVDHFSHFTEFDIASRRWRQLDAGFAGSDGKMGQFSMCIFNHKMYKFAGYNEAAQNATNEMHCYRMGKPEFTEGTVSAR